MKKLIALLMATLMVLSLCAIATVAEEGETIVSQGKSYTTSGTGEGYKGLGKDYSADLTDGMAIEFCGYNPGEWFGFYWNESPEYAADVNAPDHMAWVLVDLGEVMSDLTTFKVHLATIRASGIRAPKWGKVSVSTDGENFTEVCEFTGFNDENDGKQHFYWVNATLEEGVSARYVRFDFEIRRFMFIDEVEVYQTKASEPAATTTTTIDLMKKLGGEPVMTPGGEGNLTYTLEGGVLTAVGDTGWPCLDYPFAEAITVDVANTRLVLEATVDKGEGSIRLLGADDGATSDDIYLHQFVEGATLGGGGDIGGPATISLDIPFADLAFCDYTAESGYAGKIAFTTDTVDIHKLQVWACGGATVTITKLQLIVTTKGGEEGGSTAPVKENITVDGELNDTGWNASKWTSVKPDESGTWQGTPPVGVTGTIEYKYQIRKDDTKLYIAVVYDGPAVKIANDKNSANGSGTNFRFWIHNGDPEATVYTHFVDACLREDGTTGSMMKINGSKDTNAAGSEILDSSLKAVVTEKDGKTYCELSIDLADLSIPEGKTASVIPTVSSVFVVHNEGADDTTANLCLFAGEFPAAEEGAGYATNLPYHHWYGAQANSVTDDIALGEITAPQPDTGDSGIVALAILAIVALFGSAIVVKTRR